MPAVSELLQQLGFHQAGPDFYLPRRHPHVHLRVANAEKIVPDLAAVRAEIQFIALSWGGAIDGHPTASLYDRNGWSEVLETGSFDRAKKLNFENSLARWILTDTRGMIQATLNRLTGMGIDAM